jgi:hypothetical protein
MAKETLRNAAILRRIRSNPSSQANMNGQRGTIVGSLPAPWA